MTTNNYTGNKPQNISQIASKVVNFSVATNEWKKGQDGNKQQVTDRHNIKICNGLTDFAIEYLDKGSSIEIRDRLKTDKYEDKNGETRYSTYVLADEILMLDKKNGSANKPA